jgi:hypothetical protein
MLIPKVALRGRIVTIGTHALFHHLVIVLHHFHLIVETEGILIKFLNLRFLFQVPPTILRDHVHRQIRPLTLRLEIDLLLSLSIFLMKILLFFTQLIFLYKFLPQVPLVPRRSLSVLCVLLNDRDAEYVLVRLCILLRKDLGPLWEYANLAT